VLRDAELTLLGVLPTGQELGGRLQPAPKAAQGTAEPTRLRLSAPVQERALEAGGVLLVDDETTPIARLESVQATGSGLIEGNLVAERARESGVGRDRALSPADRAAGWQRVLVLSRPMVRADRARALGADAVLVPDLFESTAAVPTEVMLTLAHRLSDRLGDIPVRTVPLAWRDADSDALLLDSLRTWLGARHLDAVRDHPADPNVDDWSAARTALEVRMSDATLDVPDADVLAAWRPPRPRRGLVLMFTGLSGSGKSTVARALTHRLRSETTRTVSLLDGDVVRQLLSAGLGFDYESRVLNIRRIGYVAAEIARHGGVAICAPIAPYAATRAEVRAMVEPVGDFVLVHVDTPLAECERRDLKGLYAKARAGALTEFTGISDPYEKPLDAAIRIDTSTMSTAESVDTVHTYLAQQGWLDSVRSSLFPQLEQREFVHGD
jgi:sulfate adenylyltransferase